MKFHPAIAIAVLSLLMPIMTMAHDPYQSKDAFCRSRPLEEILTDFQYFCKYKQVEKLLTKRKEQPLEDKHTHELLIFENQIKFLLQLAKGFGNLKKQRKALTYIPLHDLMLKAKTKYNSLPKSNETEVVKRELVIADLLLIELLEWFKNDFFKWMHYPRCPYCCRETAPLGHGKPTFEEFIKSASYVETYTCPNCFSDRRVVTRFARYEDPGYLLDTRVGRCGEWANCFALICRAVGYEVRLVADHKNDHAWVEVYSSGLKINRWVSVDPSQNKFDIPLLYEKDWGKNMSYVIAASQDDIQDVTWRYTSKQAKVLSRRHDEMWLLNTIIRLRNEKQSRLPDERKKLLQERLIYELMEFRTPKKNEKA